MAEKHNSGARKRRSRKICSSSSEDSTTKEARLTEEQTSFPTVAPGAQPELDCYIDIHMPTNQRLGDGMVVETIDNQLQHEMDMQDVSLDEHEQSNCQHGTPPYQIASSRATTPLSPRTRITGQSIEVGMSSWDEFIRVNATFVDKSAAIPEIMGRRAGKVVVGLYPRRMGKSTFLDTLANFLDIIGSLPYSKRKEVFKECAIYDEDNQQFFNDNFAKYSVLRLNLKTASPKTDVMAVKGLRNTVIKAAKPYVRLLQDLIDGRARSDIGEVDQSNVCKFEKDIQKFLNYYDRLEELVDLQNYDEDIKNLLPTLMELLYDVLNVLSVVLVDEFDAPYMSTFRNTSIDHEMRTLIHDLYSGFLSAMLKDNSNLHKGVLVGVFDVRESGLGSGLNNMYTCMAHTGFPGISHDFNPFQHAFGFSAQDVWGLVNKFVDEQWQYRESCNDKPKFKKELIVGCLQHFEGYRIGAQHYIFNPHAILYFLNGIQHVDSPENVNYDGHDYWIATGSMRVLESIRARSIYDLRRFYMHLRTMFIQTSRYHASKGAIHTLESHSSINDNVIDTICSQEQPHLPIEYDERTGKDLADICFKSNSTFSSALAAIGSEPLDAPLIIWLLYQAGYLTPIASDRVGIPNEEVLRALDTYYGKVAGFKSASTDPLGPAYQVRGICSGDLVQFGIPLNDLLLEQTAMDINALEKHYQLVLMSFLHPAREAGFNITCEARLEGGYGDIVISPGPNHHNFPESQPVFIIFEIKRLVTGTMLHKDRMSVANCERVCAQLQAKSVEALAQIQERYCRAAFSRADSCEKILFVGITFWQRRFYFVVERYKKSENLRRERTWEKMPYKEEEVEGAATESVSIKVENNMLHIFNIS